MLSDVLHDAVVEIEQYQRELPDTYEQFTTEIEIVKTVMDAFRICLDASPGVVEEHDGLIAGLRGAIRTIDLSQLLTAQRRLSCWAGHHEWVVFSTALQEGCLMLQCVECGQMGTVDDPIKDEWAEAFHAPSRPYRWTDEVRVTVREKSSLHVIRSNGDGTRCTCPPMTEGHESSDYERFPAEIMKNDCRITDDEHHNLIDLASLAREHNWCSALFPSILRSSEENDCLRITDAAKRIVERIERIDGMGLHLSPFVVAKVLKDYAATPELRT